MSAWYLVHTKPGREALAEANLLRQGYEVYLPRLAQTVRFRGRWRERIVALFPRYLFMCAASPNQTIGPVRSTQGVSGIVQFGQEYAQVPEDLIQILRSRADCESGLHHLAAQSQLEPGSNVRISDGPFDGLEGVFEREVGDDRVIVLIELLGTCTRVRVPRDSLLPQHAN